MTAVAVAEFAAVERQVYEVHTQVETTQYLPFSGAIADCHATARRNGPMTSDLNLLHG
jgi:hypothetical protein